MNRKLFQIAILFFILLAFGSARAGSFKELEKGPLPKITPPKVDVIVLKNGIRLFMLADHMLPVVHLGVTTRTGSIYEPAGKIGLAEVTGRLMRTGGAGELPPEDFDKAVDNLGAMLSSGIGTELGEAGLSVLSEDIDAGMKLLFAMLFSPRFDEERFKTAKLKIAENLRREDDDPKALSNRRFKQLVYGKESPWARRADDRTLANISTDDVRAFHKNYFRTGNILIGVAGDFDRQKVINLIEKLSANAEQGKADLPEVQKVELKFEPGIDEVTRPMTQTFIKMGHLGIKRHNPDKYALFLMSDILGGSNFKSRLMEDIRTKRGMAYSIWSDMSPGSDYGLFLVSVNTKSAQAKEVIGLIKGHLEQMANGEGVTKDELEFARQSSLAQLVFEFDNAYKAVDRRVSFHFYGYPDNYWEIYRDRISKVTAQDIKDVAHRYIHPDGLKTVIVGPKIEGLEVNSPLTHPSPSRDCVAIEEGKVL